MIYGSEHAFADLNSLYLSYKYKKYELVKYFIKADY